MSLRSSTQQTTPRWIVTVDDLTKLFETATTRSMHPEPTYAVTFSCSSNGIWPTTRMGFMPPETRQYVEGPSTLLAAIAQQMMRMSDSWMGGRFSVTLDGATRTRDAEPIVSFELTV